MTTVNVNLREVHKQFVEAALKEGKERLERDEVRDIATKYGLGIPNWLLNNPVFKIRRGLYKLPKLDGTLELEGEAIGDVAQRAVRGSSDDAVLRAAQVAEAAEKEHVAEHARTVTHTAAGIAIAGGQYEEIIPKSDPLYVKFGPYSDIKTVVESKKFYPLFIMGLSGNGKTMMVEQACAESKRELYRVNITIETDEDDLLGGFRLVDGQTEWFDGPVVKAMKAGAILLFDEIDLGSSKLMCVQPVMEGKGVLLKKINHFVQPKPGFNVIATANTKGQGSDDGKFIGTNVMNEAFLERFPATIEQQYPPAAVERKILRKLFESHGVTDDEFIDKLIEFADVVRRAYFNHAIDQVITTRRLVHIANAFAIFKDRQKSIELCISRFDDNTKAAFLDLYSKMDDTESANSAKKGANKESEENLHSVY